MKTVEIGAIVARIDGYVDALSSVSEIHGADQAYASCINLDMSKIDESIAAHFSDSSRAFKDEFPDLEVAPYHFEKAEIVRNWIRPLHNELETNLLPISFSELIPESHALEEIRYGLAWQVMEMVRMVTDDFQSSVIYRVEFRRSLESQGVIFVIPLPDTCLVISFEHRNSVCMSS